MIHTVHVYTDNYTQRQNIGFWQKINFTQSIINLLDPGYLGSQNWFNKLQEHT